VFSKHIENLYLLRVTNLSNAIPWYEGGIYFKGLLTRHNVLLIIGTSKVKMIFIILLSICLTKGI